MTIYARDSKENIMQGIANGIRSKAVEKAVTYLTPLEWGKKYCPQFFFREGSKFHEDMSGILHTMPKTRDQKLLVMAPRGSAKSTLCSQIAPLKYICEGTEKYIIIIGDTADVAEGYLRIIANELDANDAIREKYPLACKHGDIWNAKRIETGNGTCVEAIGKGNPVRGRKFKHYRPTLIIVDDPQNDDDVASPSTRKKDLEWLDKALIPAGDTGTNMFVIGTNLHRESIVNTICSRPDFKVMKYAAIEQWPTHMELWEEWERIYLAKGDADGYYARNKAMMDDGAKVMWETKEPLLKLMQIRASSGHPAFDSERQNNPRDPSKCEFDEQWFDDDCWYDTLPAKFEKGVIRIGYGDPAKGGETKRHDYSALITLHYDIARGRCYVEADLERCPVNVFVDKLIRLFKLWKPTKIGCEANGFQSLISEEAIAKCPLIPLVEVEHYGVHKNTRISRLSIWFQRKFFIFKRGCKSTRILMEQLLDHPNAEHDDGPDGLEAALRLLTDTVDIGDDDADEDIEPDIDELGDNIFDNNPYTGAVV